MLPFFIIIYNSICLFSAGNVYLQKPASTVKTKTCRGGGSSNERTQEYNDQVMPKVFWNMTFECILQVYYNLKDEDLM